MNPKNTVNLRLRSLLAACALAAFPAAALRAEPPANPAGDPVSPAGDHPQAEVKVALTRLDVDLDLLAAKIETITDAVRKEELTKRLLAFRERRAALDERFDQARYEALAADVKAERDQLSE
ncbi:MAG: hypothetical protein JNG83_05460 [Opitutaceae bacterium]|nr:hypothetical protein [Opitutaceae bacterium]